MQALVGAHIASTANTRQPQPDLSETHSPTYRVHLLDEATVVERGERVRVWFIPYGDAWIRAAEHPAATVELSSAERSGESCPPGTIWQRSVELILPAKTPLLSRITSPLTERLEPMEYLKRGRLGTRRHVNESWFQVVGNYRIARLPAAPESYHDATESKAR